MVIAKGILACVLLTELVAPASAAEAQIEAMEQTNLLHLAFEHFKSDSPPISTLESNLFAQATLRMTNGFAIVPLRLTGSKTNKDFQEIRANRIEWLCTDRSAKKMVSDCGISISDARIRGDLNLNWVDVNFPVRIRNSLLENAINLNFSHFGALDFSGTVISNTVHGEGMRIDHHVYFCEGFRAEKGLDMEETSIGGNLNCCGGYFGSMPGENALSAYGSTIGGYVYFCTDTNSQFHFEAHGRVSLMKTTIGLGADCRGGIFIALDAKDEGAIRMTDMIVHGYVILGYGFKAIGGVSLAGCEIDDYFSDIDGFIFNPSSGALDLSGSKIGGTVHLSGTNYGQVRLAYARIAGALLSDGRFECTNGPAISARCMHIDGNISIDASLGMAPLSIGELNFDGAEVGGDMDITSATFCCGSGSMVFSARDAIVKGHVHISSSKIGGVMSFRETTIDSDFWWWSTNTVGELDLTLVETKALWLGSVKEWPSRIDLDGFAYDRVVGSGGQSSANLIAWLRQQPLNEFHPQPYERLAEALRKAGDNSSAKDLLIAKNDDKYWRAFPKSFHPLWWVYRACVRYGYEPWWALLYSLTFIAFGWAVFRSAHLAGMMQYIGEKVSHKGPIKKTKQDYRLPFPSFIYSMEKFVPLLTFDVGKNWSVSVEKNGPLFFWMWRIPGVTLTKSKVQAYLYLHIVLGWVLTTLWVGALTGLVKD